jgi:SAM-dependent methyltransferase
MESTSIRERLIRSYSRNPEARDERPIRRWKLDERERFCRILLREGKRRLLELGAGTGRDGAFFLSMGMEVLATDITPRMVEICRSKGLTARLLDACAIDLPRESFSAVYAMNCLHHVPKREFGKALQGTFSVLEAGGLFYLCNFGGRDHEGTLPRDPYSPPRFYSLYSEEAIRKAVSGLFSIEDFRSFDIRGPLPAQAMILRKKATPA